MEGGSYSFELSLSIGSFVGPVSMSVSTLLNYRTEPEFVNFLRSPGIDSQPGGIDSLNRFLGSLNVYKFGQSNRSRQAGNLFLGSLKGLRNTGSGSI
jgi:hypothetical protein